MEIQTAEALKTYFTCYTISDENTFSPALKDHSQIPYIIDTLARKERHHLFLHGFHSEKLTHSLVEGIAYQLKTGIVPKNLRDATLIYFDACALKMSHAALITKCADYIESLTTQSKSDSLIVLCINDVDACKTIMQSKILNPQWRIILFSQESKSLPLTFENYFSHLALQEPSQQEMLALLKNYKNDIENYHNILMPDEIFRYALSLTEHYLGGKSRLDKTLELLDSGAARASTLERDDETSQTYKPILTTTILAHVVSSWTHIPISHLHHNKFRLSKFSQFVKQKIFGQEAAINAVGSILQASCIQFSETDGTVCNLLLAGPCGVGKKEFSLSLANYLFSTTEALLHVILDKHNPPASLNQIVVTTQSDTKQRINLLDAIQAKPYAVLLIENLNEMPATTINLFNDILVHGYGFDDKGNLCDFSHTVVVITSESVAEKISQLTQQQAKNDPTPIMDLMQLVLNESPTSNISNSTLSQHELREHLFPVLQTYFSADILRQSHIVTFMPLDQTTIERIVKLKLNRLAKSLFEEFEIELSYAPEVSKFLATETLKQQQNAQMVEPILKQHVLSTIANELLAKMDEKNKPKHLALLLNETGQMIRCEFINTNENIGYAV